MMSNFQLSHIFLYTHRLFIAAAVLFIVMLFIAGSADSAGLSKEQISELFAQANALFHQADQTSSTQPEKAEALYKQAALRYETIVTQGGLQNGKLYYDIGNAYFRTKDIGRAILNYRRALAYIPDDPNLLHNLSYARNKRLDQIEEPQETKVFKTLFFWHYDLSTPVKIILFSIFFPLAWLLAGLRRFFKRPFLGWALFFAVVMSMIMNGSLTVEAIALHRVIPGVIIDASTVARKGNSENYAQSFTEPLHAGTEFNLLEKRDGWYNVALMDGRTCWLPAKSLELVR
jgi:hypothetical protein